VSVPIGRPIVNTQVYALDRYLHPVPVGVAGELYIGGDGLARGYLNQPGLTASRFVPDPFSREPGQRLYRTGDRVRYRPDGRIEFLGRSDDQVKIRGFRVEPGEIESALHQHPSVQDCVVLPRVERGGGKRLVAYVVPVIPDPQSLTRELREFLKGKLPEYMMLSDFVWMERLPLNPNGKVDRRALPAPVELRAGLSDGIVAPRSPLERQLAQLWEEILDTRPIGIRDDFFDLGGHSMMAVRLVARIRKEIRQELPLAALFQCPTIELLVACLRSPSGVQAQSQLVLQDERTTRGAGFAVQGEGSDPLIFEPRAMARLDPGRLIQVEEEDECSALSQVRDGDR
jgi:aspartate racemase